MGADCGGCCLTWTPVYPDGADRPNACAGDTGGGNEAAADAGEVAVEVLSGVAAAAAGGIIMPACSCAAKGWNDGAPPAAAAAPG